MDLLSCVLLAMVGSGHLLPLSLQLSAANTTVYVGEPIRLEVNWSVTEPLEVDSAINILVGRDERVEPWSEAAIGIATKVDIVRQMMPGFPRVTVHTLSAAGRMDTTGGGDLRLAIPDPGTYVVKAEYRDGRDVVMSNSVVLRAVMPLGSEREVLDQYIKPRPQLVTPWLELLDPSLLRSLFRRYPASRYLRRSKLLFYRSQLSDAIIEAPEPPPNGAIEGRVPALLDELESDDFGDSPFEEDRMLMLAEICEQSGRPARARHAWEQILRRFPSGVAAQEARRRLPIIVPSPLP
jgi:hypothetical protein